MNLRSAAPPLLAIAMLAACPGDDARNPSRLYIALLTSELNVRLVEVEPQPF